MKPYQISDLLVRLQTALTTGHPVTIHFNLDLLAILTTLQSLGLLTFTLHSNSIVISLRPNSFSHFIIHSKPSRRIYKSYKDLWTHNAGLGISILRTSHGIKTLHQARTQHIGGELLFTIF